MTIEKEHISKIRAAFSEMQSREDFLRLLNMAKEILYDEKAKPFKLNQLTYYYAPTQKRDYNSFPAITKDFVKEASLSDRRYTTFSIKKKSGDERKIHAPVAGLNAIQESLSFILQCVFEPHKGAMGFVRGKSIVDNARLHEGSNYVYNIDLKDFFFSVDQARVWACLQLRPFNLVDIPAQDSSSHRKANSGVRKIITDHGERLFYKITENGLHLIYDRTGNLKKYIQRIYSSVKKADNNDASESNMARLFRLSDEREKALWKDISKYINIKTEVTIYLPSRSKLANIIASLCCTEIEVERLNKCGQWEKVKKNVLPQGAPTSPVVTNIVCQRLDFLLSAVAKRFGLKYSRYADDITFSSMHNVYQPESDFLKEIKRIITEQGFHIKESKTRLQKEGYRQEVTGLLVNEKANTQKRYIKQLRMWLYYWETYGYTKTHEFFLKQFEADKKSVIGGVPDMKSVMSGKLEFLKMVKGSENELYLKLRGRFEALTGISVKTSERDKHLSKVIDILLEKGVDEAMDYFKPSNS